MLLAFVCIRVFPQYDSPVYFNYTHIYIPSSVYQPTLPNFCPHAHIFAHSPLTVLQQTIFSLGPPWLAGRHTRHQVLGVSLLINPHLKGQTEPLTSQGNEVFLLVLLVNKLKPDLFALLKSYLPCPFRMSELTSIQAFLSFSPFCSQLLV